MEEDLARVGESALIRLLLAQVPTREDVIVGPGDDAALVSAGGARLLATADLLVEGEHFDLAFSHPADVGYKAVAVNVSDIAAMGGRPLHALVALGAPADTRVATLEALYRGVGDAAKEFGVSIAGGDTVRAPQLLVSVALVGEPPAGGPVRRDGARSGDVLCVTGVLGAAAAGLRLLRAASTDPEAARLLARLPDLADAHRRGRARAAEGAAAAAHGARAMIDLSDGLGIDVGRICEASGIGVEIDAASLPIAVGVTDVASWSGDEPWRVGVSGGDDYELAIAAPPEMVDELARGAEPTRLTAVGRFTPSDAVILTPDGVRLPLGDLGWDAFRG